MTTSPVSARPEVPAPRARHRGRRMLLVGLPALAVGLLVRATLVAPLTVESASMEPTLSEGDTVLVTRFATDLRELDRGELVVFDDPAEHQLTLKRVVGLPGEELVVLDGVLYVDDHEVAEPWVDPATVDGYYSRTFQVPVGHVFVMGDNRSNSVDSRDYGSIGAEELRGVVLVRLWPPGRFDEGRD